MDGYLLDTNLVSCWHDPSRLELHTRVKQYMSSLDPGSPLLISSVTMGEIHYGHQTAKPPNPAKQREFFQFVQQRFPMPLPITETTAESFGILRALLFEKYAPAVKKKGLRPEQLRNPITGLLLGIQENDVWIAAQALEHNLILVTHDKMTNIHDIAPAGLRFVNWTKTSSGRG